MTPSHGASVPETSPLGRGAQDLSCTGHDLGVAVCIAVGVAQALTPHGEKWSSGLRKR